MNIDKLTENIVGQIKEAQLKLGFARESIRLYYPVESLCRLLQVKCRSDRETLEMLEKEAQLAHTELGRLRFSVCKGRAEVCVSQEGVDYVHEQIPDPPFLKGLIQLFRDSHELSIDDIRRYFAGFSDHYICERMKPDEDFDYVLYFPDQEPDAWYYCIRVEMGHTIYHRFSADDYRYGVAEHLE